MEEQKEKTGKVLKFPVLRKKRNFKPLDSIKLYKLFLIANMVIMAASFLLLVYMKKKI